MRHALSNGTALDQTGQGLGMAPPLPHASHYRTSGTRTKAPPHAGGPPYPHAGPRKKTPKTRSPPGETVGLLKSIKRLRKHTERHVGSKGMPHVGHADSVTSDEHGSWPDISDWSSSNPVTRVIKVTLPTPAIFFIIISYIHTRIHSICPCPLG